MKNFDNLKIKKDVVKRGIKRSSRNDEIADMYLDLGERRRDENLMKKFDTLRNCFKTWTIDYYRDQKVKDVLSVLRCHDIFCQNCQAQLSAVRAEKYVPLLDRIIEEYDLYHITHTVPNCLGPELKNTVDKMYKKFAYVAQYFFGKRNAKGVDFSQFGCVGIIRALEISTKLSDKGLEFHPHFHCIYVMEKGLRGLCKPKLENVNVYSFSQKNGFRAFSDFEIFMQKMWFLLYEGFKFTLDNLESIREGYSGTVDKCKKGKYHEVFKYVMKGLFKDNMLSFDTDAFQYLYDTLHRRKVIQGYGIFYNCKFESDEFELSEEEREAEYEKIIDELRSIERPWCGYEKPTDVLESMGRGITYISRRRIAEEVKQRNKK